MAPLATDTIGGLNTFIEEQKAIPGEVDLDIFLFDDKYEELYRGNLQDAPIFTSENYFARGWTALYDAIGRTVNSLGVELAAMPENERPDKVLVMILTDGLENSSHKFTDKQIKDMIQHQESVYNWTFIYLGANQDSFAVGAGLGIQGVNTMNWMPDPQGTRYAYTSMSNYARSYREK